MTGLHQPPATRRRPRARLALLLGLAPSGCDALAPDPKFNSLVAPELQNDFFDIYGCESCMALLARRKELRYMAQMTAGAEENRLHVVGALCQSMQGFEGWKDLCESVVNSLSRHEKWVHLWEDYYGCHKITPGGLALTMPCPAHVVCSWITHNVNHLPFCSPDHTYKSPNHPREWENEPHWRSAALPKAQNRDTIENDPKEEAPKGTGGVLEPRPGQGDAGAGGGGGGGEASPGSETPGAV